MGVKELWTILAPYCERKPMNELKNKVVAIDLAGWVCESLNVVDYFVHPRQYLKNLFFRTCYLLMMGVVPIFVLEGVAPELKHDIISKRNEIQFRGVKPRNTDLAINAKKTKTNPKGRSRFNYVLKKCEELLKCIGVNCLQAPGEAEAYCAYLNARKFVDGIISQDSDCFAYGALKVYRNFSVSTQGKTSCQSGSVDIYDMEKIASLIDFGQNKIIALALLCGCDYCPEGVGGVGRDSVLKLFSKYNNDEILDIIRLWRKNNNKYTSLEIKVNDKNVCSNCGHIGKLLNHSKRGCETCRTVSGCDDTIWKNQRLILKAELMLRKKALSDANFPSEAIINEFLKSPDEILNINTEWKQPNVVKFIKTFANDLQWEEIYTFQKCLPLLTRWQLLWYTSSKSSNKLLELITPQIISKQRILRGIPSYEIIWIDKNNNFEHLIPDDQLQKFLIENDGKIENLWTTIEPADLVQQVYKDLVESFTNLKENKKNKSKQRTRKPRKENCKHTKNSSLNDMNSILKATEEIEEKAIKKKDTKKELIKAKGDQSIKKFFKYSSTPVKIGSRDSSQIKYSSLNISNYILDLESDNENDFNYSEILNQFMGNPIHMSKYEGKKLFYPEVKYVSRCKSYRSRDDSDILTKKEDSPSVMNKSHSHSNILDSLLLENQKQSFLLNENNYINNMPSIESIVDRFKKRERALVSPINQERYNKKPKMSSFFENILLSDSDEFEKSFDIQ